MRLLLPIFLCMPLMVICQLSDTLRDRVRNTTSDYSMDYDTLIVTGSKTLTCLDIRINGKGPYRFLIDLGSNVVLFKQSVVDSSHMGILVDRARGDIVKADQLEIGNSVFNQVHGAAYEDLDVDGVIGFNLLRKANFFIDYPNMKFGFIQKEPEHRDSTYIKYELIGRMPYLQSTVGNKNTYVNFDTGAALWLYFPLHWKDSVQFKSKFKEFKSMTNNQTGSTMTYLGQIKEDVRFGNYIIPSPEVVFDPDIEDIFVGSSLLNQFKLAFFTKLELVKMDRRDKGNLIFIPYHQEKKDK